MRVFTKEYKLPNKKPPDLRITDEKKGKDFK